MTTSRGSGVNLQGNANDGYTITVPGTDQQKVEKVLAAHGIHHSVQGGGHLQSQPDDVEFVLDRTIDMNAVQEILDGVE